MNAAVQLENRDDGSRRITVARPEKHNALAGAVLAELRAAFAAVAGDPQAKLVVLRGAGERFFAAGGDLVELAAVRTDAQTRSMADEATAALEAVRDCPVPVIAYLNGDALGGGAELALACDLRLFAPHARLGFIQGRLAIGSAWGGGADLFALVGPARATRMMARAEMIDASTALAWGLADAVIDGGPDGEAACAFIGPMLERSGRVLRGIKAQARAQRAGQPLAERRAVEREHLVATWLSDEHWQAVDRFMKRDRA